MAKQAASRTRSTPHKRRSDLIAPPAEPMMIPAPMPAASLSTASPLAAPMLTHDAIARRAFELYLARGQAGGDEMSDWLRAETELRSAQL